MTKEQEAINNIKVFIRSIKSDLAEESEDNQKLANDIETVLSMLKGKDKQIDLMAEKIFDEGIVWEDKEEVKQYFERKATNNG